MTRAEYMEAITDKTSPRYNPSPSYRITKITVGAAIVRGSGAQKQILLLKRNTTEAYYPNVFEMPGGKVDESDASIRDAIIREVAEETQLKVADIKFPLFPIYYTTEKKVLDEKGNAAVLQRHAVQLSYVVEIEGDGRDFVVNKDELSEGMWADAEALEKIPITRKMRGLVDYAMSERA